MQFKTPEEFHNKLGFIFHAMLAIPLVGFIYLFLEIKNRDVKAALENGEQMYSLIALLGGVAILLVGYGYYLFRKEVSKIHASDALKAKLQDYYKSIIKFYVLIEAASVLLVVGLYLTTSSVFIVIFMFVLLVLSLNRPTPQKYAADLGLKGEEQEIILKRKTQEI